MYESLVDFLVSIGIDRGLAWRMVNSPEIMDRIKKALESEDIVDEEGNKVE